MKQELDCPKCRQHFVAYDTVSFKCSNCESEVNAQAGVKVYSDRIETDRRIKVRSENLAKAFKLLIPLAIGMYFHWLGFFSLVLFVVATAWLLVESRLLKRLRPAKIAAACLFSLLVGTIAGDAFSPPTAQCRDFSYSYSEHNSGTCSWHRGVREWNPGPWWATLFR
jgi:hypothetical protein